MEEKETFGVELKAITEKFSQKMEQMKNKIVDFGKIAKQNLETGMYMDTKGAQKELQDLENEYNKLIQDSNNGWSVSQQQISSVSTRISDLKKDINTINTSKIAKAGKLFSDLKNRISTASIETKKFGKNIQSSFDKGIKSIKRFALSLFGIQSIWRAVSRASSAYLSQDIELSNKLQAVWVGLGSMLSPILEKLANFFLKLVGYLNIFIKAVFGVDLLGKAMEKANKNTMDTNKSVKALKGQLGGFDEINNIADNSAGANADNSNIGWTDAFKNVQLDTSWTETITNFGIWLKDNWELLAIGLGGIAIALTSLGLAGSLSAIGLGAIVVPLIAIGLAIAGIVAVVLGIKELFSETGNQTKAWTLILGGLLAIVLAVGLAFGAIPMAIAALVAAVTAGVLWIIKNWDDVKSALSKGISAIGNWFKGLWEGIKNIFGTIGKWFSDRFTDAWNGIKKAFSSVGTFFKNIWNTIKSIFTTIGTTIGNAIGGALKTVVNKIIGFAENTINGFIKAINAAIGLINKIPGVEIKKLSLLNIPKLDTGTNYVPNDQLAYIHKGEAVVPKKFNSYEYFNRGNDETNSLLNTLIEKLEEKDFSVSLDGKVIGRSTVNYINNQNRIMGRSVV